ncbi:MAG: nucleoside kinase [Alistipes sp.]|nr:nucleoside kinase [Alistipes sp.]
MSSTIRIICENTTTELWVKMGTSLAELAKLLPTPALPYLAATVNNRLKELHYRIYKPVNVRFIDQTSYTGISVLHRTAWFVLQRAVELTLPSHTLRIRHEMGQSGFYCEIEGVEAVTPEQCAALREAMQQLIDRGLPIYRQKLLTEEVKAHFEEHGFHDKVELLDTCPRLYSDLYTLDGSVGYFYGALAPSTNYLTHFCLRPYYKGFYLGLPQRTNPEAVSCELNQEKMFDIFREYQSWVGMMGIPTIGAINRHILQGNAGALIKVAEAFHERKFVAIADAIYEAHASRGMRMVLISGPSSSGKTTSSKRLSIQLGVLGLKPVIIALDDYFVDRDKTPRDEKGDYDFEALEAIDLELFNDHLQRLIAGESVEIPRYNFITGSREWHEEPLTLDENSILIVEGIHGLNPRLTPSIPDDQKFRIYISCFTSVAMDNISCIAPSDNRLVRRLVRDYSTRGADAVATIARFPSVRRGEEKHIYPFQENADVMLNSSLFYELSVLRPYAERILREVPDTVPEYRMANHLLRFLENFAPISPDEIPHTSILREFIGGSTFRY